MPWLLRSVHKFDLPLFIRRVDVELLQRDAHREQVVAEVRIIRFEAHVQVLYLHLKVVDYARRCSREHALLLLLHFLRLDQIVEKLLRQRVQKPLADVHVRVQRI